MDMSNLPVQMLVRWLLAGVVFLGVFGSACRYAPDVLRFASTNGTRLSDNSAERWAEPMQVDGLPNLHRVSAGLYRGAQPTAAGFKELKNLGVRTVVNLREPAADRAALQGTGLAYECIPMTAFRPKDDDVVRFLQVVARADGAPLFVHCKRGADRTGMMCAIYRIAVQGWSKEQALAEMTRGGFGFNQGYQNLVRYIQALDIGKIKQRAGWSRTPVAPRTSSEFTGAVVATTTP